MYAIFLTTVVISRKGPQQGIVIQKKHFIVLGICFITRIDNLPVSETPTDALRVASRNSPIRLILVDMVAVALLISLNHGPSLTDMLSETQTWIMRQTKLTMWHQWPGYDFKRKGARIQLQMFSVVPNLPMRRLQSKKIEAQPRGYKPVETG